MNDFKMTRRHFSLLAAGVAAASAMPFAARAAVGETAIAATFPGNWEDGYRSVLTPLVKESGYGLTIAPSMAQDQLAKVDGRWLFTERRILNEFLPGRESGPGNPIRSMDAAVGG